MLRRAAFSLGSLAIGLGLLVFVPAGTAHYWEAWVYLSIFVGASVLITLYLMRRDPALLERRMRVGPAAEDRPAQRIIVLAVSLLFIALQVVPGLDVRFGWSVVPTGVVVVGDLLVVLGFYLTFLVYRANTFAAATIGVVEHQQVISTGPYAIVRHPMYASASMYLLGTPLALRSYWGLPVFGAMLPFLVWRILDEELLLTKNLPGYAEYQQRVRYRLVPFVW